MTIKVDEIMEKLLNTNTVKPKTNVMVCEKERQAKMQIDVCNEL